MTNRSAQPRVRTWGEAAEALHHQRIEAVVEALHRHQVHRGAALRLECVQRHAITELVQCDGQRRGRRALLLVHGVAESACLGDRSGDIKQHEHRQIPATAQVVQVDGFVGCRPGQRLDPRLDRGVDVDVVALRLPMAAIQPDPEPRQRPPQRMDIGRSPTDAHP